MNYEEAVSRWVARRFFQEVQHESIARRAAEIWNDEVDHAQTEVKFVYEEGGPLSEVTWVDGFAGVEAIYYKWSPARKKYGKDKKRCKHCGNTYRTNTSCCESCEGPLEQVLTKKKHGTLRVGLADEPFAHLLKEVMDIAEEKV